MSAAPTAAGTEDTASAEWQCKVLRTSPASSSQDCSLTPSPVGYLQTLYRTGHQNNLLNLLQRWGDKPAAHKEVCSWPSHKLGCHPLPGQARALRLPLKSPCLPACECSLSLLPTRPFDDYHHTWRPDSPSCHSMEESHCIPRRREARHPAERSPRGATSQPWEPALAQGQPGEEAKVWGKNRWRGSRVRSGRKTVEELQRD